MYIKNIEIDGFKSYGRRTVVGEFDPHFNAITGFNGSGKSNILDSICFLLGITKMENIRAKTNLDLIHKQGQTGITKASVTITFDNRDKSCSPIGYSNYDEIIVKRMLTKDRSQSLINGVTCPSNKAADFFRGIGLNVNNPHFLIMQGRITRVLNMKPEEILGMIEEAAGTKMYDQKRKDSLKTIVAKQAKVDEVTSLLEENINPQMEKMREDRKNLVEYNQVKKKFEGNQRKLVAYTYHTLTLMETEHLKRSEEKEKEIEAARAKIVELGESMEELKGRLQELEEKRIGEADDKALEAQLKELRAEGISKESERDDVSGAAKKIEEEIKRQKKTLISDEKQLEKAEKALHDIEKNATGETLDGSNQIKEIEKLRKEREALARGLITNDDGESMSIESKIQASRSEASNIEASLQTAVTRQNRLKPVIEDLKKQLKSKSEKKVAELQGVDKQTELVHSLEKKLQKLNFDESEDMMLREKISTLRRETKTIQEKMTQLHRRYPRTEFNCPDTPGVDKEHDVLGVLCTLFSVKDEYYAFAIEIAATTYLTQVVVDNLAVAKRLIEHGKLTTRRTFIPVKDARPRFPQARPAAGRIKLAEEHAARNGDTVVQALDLIDYPKELKVVMENVFGNGECMITFVDADTAHNSIEIYNGQPFPGNDRPMNISIAKFKILIVNSLKCAKEICYDKRIFTRTVTVDGEDVVPRGTMTGGGCDRNRTMLKDIAPFMSYRQELKARTTELQEAEEQLQRTEAISQEYFKTKDKLDHEKASLASIKDNMANTEVGLIKSELEAATNDLEKVNQEIVDKKQQMVELRKLITDLESRKKNEKDFTSKETKRINTKLAELEKQMEKNKKSNEDANMLLLTKQEEVKEQRTSIENTKKTIEELETELEGKSKELAEKQKAYAEHEAKVNAMRSELDGMKKNIRQFDDEIKKTNKKIDTQRMEAKKLESSLENLEEEQKNEVTHSQKCKVEAAKTKKKNEWIADEMHLFGRKQSEYDFTGYTREKGEEAVEDMRKKKEDLEKKVNPKINSILDSMEAKVVDLVKKRTQVEKDKEKLLETIKVLDERKKKEIEIAFEAVDKDFGSIFETLLPGAQAKLKKVNEKDVLDGVEVKVAFNMQWKDSLQELSGGQRSLVALSLVLAMLKFKPAPLYILDEVDAALDLSHTANIGKMIKTHFTNSQFVVVSLKEGMFSNANVIFRTRFADGSSEVSRTVNTPSN